MARDLLGERFAAPAPPSLPALGESEVPALEDSETTLANEEAARIAEVMQEIERSMMPRVDMLPRWVYG